MKYPIDYERVWAHVNFIGSEAARFAKMSIDEWRTHEPRSDLLHTLPACAARTSPTIIGRHAFRRLKDLCSLYIDGAARREDYDFRVVFDEMARRLTSDVFLASPPPDDEGLSSMLYNLTAALDDQCVFLIHHIPCVTTAETRPSQYSIGPVTFTMTTQFMSDKATAIQNYEAAYAESVTRARATMGPGPLPEVPAPDGPSPYVREFREFFLRFPWIASVPIDACHPKVSQARAARTVQAAIDLLCVATSDDRGQQMRMGYSAAEPFKSARLSETADGALLLSHRSAVQGAVFGDGWHDALVTNWGWFYAIGGQALTFLTKRGALPPIWRRYFDALKWYGEGIRDVYLPGQIVNFATCLERLVITGPRGNITNKLSSRVGILLGGNDPEYPQPLVCSDVERLYRIRCDILHGSDIPSRDDLEWGLGNGAHICAQSLIRSLDLFAALSRRRRFTDAALGDAFHSLRKGRLQ